MPSPQHKHFRLRDSEPVVVVFGGYLRLGNMEQIRSKNTALVDASSAQRIYSLVVKGLSAKSESRMTGTCWTYWEFSEPLAAFYQRR